MRNFTTLGTILGSPIFGKSQKGSITCQKRFCRGSCKGADQSRGGGGRSARDVGLRVGFRL